MTEEGSSASLGKTYLHNYVGPSPDGLSQLHHKVLLAACCRISAVVSLLPSRLMSRLKLTGTGDFQGAEFIASCGATSTPAVSVSSSAALPIRRPLLVALRCCVTLGSATMHSGSFRGRASARQRMRVAVPFRLAHVEGMPASARRGFKGGQGAVSYHPRYSQ